MDIDFRAELRRPLTLTLAVVATITSLWLLVLLSIEDRTRLQLQRIAMLEDKMRETEQQLIQLAAKRDGTVAEIALLQQRLKEQRN